MATAESVKAKIQGLIDKSNAKTAKEDTTLSAAVDSLIESYGGGDDGRAEAYLAMLNGTDIPEDYGTLNVPDGVVRVPAHLYNGYLGYKKKITATIPDSVKYIGTYAFSGIGYSSNTGGADFYFNNTVENIGERAFNNSRYCVFHKIPKSVITIDKEGFSGGHSLTTPYPDDLDFPNITTIGTSAFSNFLFGGENVHLGKNITSIGTNAFFFKDSPAFTLTIDRAEDAISGAPWGATNATIIWTGDS